MLNVNAPEQVPIKNKEKENVQLQTDKYEKLNKKESVVEKSVESIGLSATMTDQSKMTSNNREYDYEHERTKRGKMEEVEAVFRNITVGELDSYNKAKESDSVQDNQVGDIDGSIDNLDQKENTEGRKSCTTTSPILKCCQTCNKPGHTTENCSSSPRTILISARSGHTTDGHTVNSTDKSRGHPIKPCSIRTKGKFICQLCKRKGHSTDQCFKLFPPLNSKTCNNVRNITACQICNRRGHSAERCFRISPPENKNLLSVPLTCQLCKGTGHIAVNSRWLSQVGFPPSIRQGGQVPPGPRFRKQTDVKCQICKQVGHGAYICPYRHYQAQGANGNQAASAEETSNGPKPVGICHHCYQPGHFIRECPTKRTSDARYGNSSGSINGLKTTGSPKASTQQTYPTHTISPAAPNFAE